MSPNQVGAQTASRDATRLIGRWTWIALALALILGACDAPSAGGPQRPGVDRAVTWAPVRVPPTGNGDESLSSVACPSADECWAVGGDDSNGSYGMIDHYDGNHWTAFPSPGATLSTGETSQAGEVPGGALNGVTCVSAADCWAVGYYSPIWRPYPLSGNREKYTLVEHYDGTAWTLFAAPVVEGTASYIGPARDVLTSVSCDSATSCWAVGSFETGGGRLIAPAGSSCTGGCGAPPTPTASLVEHFDGRSWVTTSLPADGYITQLNAVTCPSPGTCWAAGTRGATAPYLLHLADGVWSAIASPAADGVLNAITCASALACWAGGAHVTKAGTLLLRYAGSHWTVAQALPVTPTSVRGSTSIGAIACRTTMDCWATGWGLARSASQVAIAFHFDGSSWSAGQASNSSNPSPSAFRGIAWAGPNVGWAVGWAVGSSGKLAALMARWAQHS